MTRTDHERWTVLQEAISVVARRAKDLRLHQLLSERVGKNFDGPYHGTLKRVGQDPDCTLSELADLLNLELSTVSRRVKALEALGLVERRANPADGRSFRVRLSEPGAGVLETLEEGWREMLVEILDGWTPAETVQLTRALVRFADDFDRFAVAARSADPGGDAVA